MSEPTRLNRALARAGVASRRAADGIIRSGRVTVDGVLVREPGTPVATDARIVVDGDPITAERHRYVLLHKPTGVVTTTNDEHGRRTVLDLVHAPVRLYPVGRLDRDTSGLLLLTNDGDLAARLMHPRYGCRKTYRARVRGRLSEATLRRLRAGVELDDGAAAALDVTLVREGRDTSIVDLVLGEGRNRQVRRMLAAVDHPVLGLARIGYGPLQLEQGLAPGRHRQLRVDEVAALRAVVGLPGQSPTSP